MAAGLGFKTFAVGEVLSAANVNGYLMQGVLVFADATARDAAITSPQEGQFAFTKDNDSLWYYSGSAWVSSGATGDIEGVTAGIGISGGGTSGTVTVTNSMATAIDAKGDLIGGTGADTFARLAVGANDTVLTADSSTATGLKWAAPAGGSSFVGAMVYRSSAQTISNNSFTSVNFNAEQYDTNNFHDNTTNSNRLTIPSGKSGYYLLNGFIAWEANVTGVRSSRFVTDTGDLYNNLSIINAGTPYGTGTQISAVVYLAAAAWVEMKVHQTSGGNLDLSSGIFSANFSIAYLGA
jgi:hypothetical protein